MKCFVTSRPLMLLLALCCLVGQHLASRAAVPVFADASVCAQPGVVYLRMPLGASRSALAGETALAQPFPIDAVATQPRPLTLAADPQSLPTADISVTITDSPDPVTRGGNLTYTITMSNAGPNIADQSEMTFNLPAGTTFVSLAEPNCWNCTTPMVGATGTVFCEHPGFTAGNDQVFTVVVQVTNSVPTGVPLQAMAAIAANVFDPQSGDQEDTTSTTVLAPSPTATLTPPKPSTDDSDKPRSRTETQRQQDDRTNQSGRDDYHTEGNVVEVVLNASPPYVVIATRDGLARVLLNCPGGCPTIQVGDYIQADGVKEHEALFDAESISITRNGR